MGKGVTFMVMWKLKKCPRCGGDFFIEQDIYGWYEQCLQCSYRQELPDIAEFQKQAAQREEGTGKVGVLRPKRRTIA
jgi:hypothetical protein